jgi:hypothetical protein
MTSSRSKLWIRSVVFRFGNSVLVICVKLLEIVCCKVDLITLRSNNGLDLIIIIQEVWGMVLFLFSQWTIIFQYDVISSQGTLRNTSSFWNCQIRQKLMCLKYASSFAIKHCLTSSKQSLKLSKRLYVNLKSSFLRNEEKNSCVSSHI